MTGEEIEAMLTPEQIQALKFTGEAQQKNWMRMESQGEGLPLLVRFNAASTGFSEDRCTRLREALEVVRTIPVEVLIMWKESGL